MPLDKLPYLVLTSILAHAVGPLMTRQYLRNDTVKWLIQVAKVCKALTEPALSVLYFSPPIDSQASAKTLTILLSTPPEKLILDYSRKVKAIEIHQIDRWTGRMPDRRLELTQLVGRCPQLKSLITTSARDFADSGNKGYPYVKTQAALIQQLETTGIRLEDWAWNLDLAELAVDFLTMQCLHDLGCFHGLVSVTIAHCPAFDVGEEDLASADGQALASALNVLPSLRRLGLLQVHFATKVLSSLSHELEGLTLIDCDDLTSAQLDTYLISGGSHLTEVRLRHNHQLNISFLSALGVHCPRLAILEVSMLLLHDRPFYKALKFDSYASLFDPQSAGPTWPSSLQHLSLVNLQKADKDSAEMLFDSLLQHSLRLPCLRFLEVKISVDVDWRDRSIFRQKWIGTLEETFLWTSAIEAVSARLIKPPARKSEHPQALGRRKSRRINYNEDSSDEADRMDTSEDWTTSPAVATPPSGDAGNEDMQVDRAAKQGMCSIVDIGIDNNRPAEDHFRESDFLDSEASGDDDWTE